MSEAHISLYRIVSGYGEAVPPLSPERQAALDELLEQHEAQRETTQKWYDEAHEQQRRANRAETVLQLVDDACRHAAFQGGDVALLAADIRAHIRALNRTEAQA